jgi:hypothetical protein
VNVPVVRDFGDGMGQYYQCLDQVNCEADPEGYNHASFTVTAIEEKHEASAYENNVHLLMIGLECHLSRPISTFVTELTIICR